MSKKESIKNSIKNSIEDITSQKIKDAMYLILEEISKLQARARILENKEE